MMHTRNQSNCNRKNIAYAIGGWKGESIKLSLNSALYSVKQLEDESTICSISIKGFGVNSLSFSFTVILDRSLPGASSSRSNIEVRWSSQPHAGLFWTISACHLQ